MICSRCGNKNKSGAKFCRGCGANLAAAAAEANAAVPKQEHKTPAVQPAAVNAKPVSAPRAARRGVPRMVWILLVLVVVFAIDGFLLYIMNDVLGTENTMRYNFLEFSISMSPDMQLYSSRGHDEQFSEELEINGEEFKESFAYYKYGTNDTVFFAFASSYPPSSYFTDSVKDNCGEITYQLAKDQIFCDLMPDFSDGADKPYKVDDGIIRFRGKGADGNIYYFYGKEIVKYGNVYVCCFLSPYENDDRVISWLSTVKVNNYR